MSPRGRRWKASDGRAGCPGAADALGDLAAVGGRPPGGQHWSRNALRRRWWLCLDVDARMLLKHVRGQPLVPSLAPGALAGVDRLADFGQLAPVGGAAAFHSGAVLARDFHRVLVIDGIVARLG